MRYVSNPSCEHPDDLLKLFKKYSSSIYQKDFTQYDHESMVIIIFTVERAKELSIKNDSILWLTEQVWKNRPSKKQVEEDYISVVSGFERNKKYLNEIQSYNSVHEIKDALESISENEDYISEEDAGIMMIKDGWILAFPETTRASIYLGKGTKWCTAATKSTNYFLNYVADIEKPIFLFYLIRINGNTLKNPNDKISVGFYRNGLMIQDEDYSATVNSVNDPLKMDDILLIVGDLFNAFYDKMKEKIDSIQMIHPATKEMQKIASSFERYKRKIEDMTKEDVDVFSSIIALYPNLDEKLEEYLATFGGDETKRSLAKNATIKPETMLLFMHGDFLDILAMNKSITREIQLRILSILLNTRNPDFSKETAWWFCKNKSVGEDLIEKLADSGISAYYFAVLNREGLSERIKIKLASIPDNNEITSLFYNRKLVSYRIQKAVLENNRLNNVLYALASNPNIHPKISREMIDKHHDNYHLMVALATNENLDETSRLKLVKQTSESIRLTLARIEINERVQMALANDASMRVLTNLATHNYKLSKKVQLALIEKMEPDILDALKINGALNRDVRDLLFSISY